MLIVSWNVGPDISDSDKPVLFDYEPKGFLLADYYMARLYHQKTVWNKIIGLVSL